MAPNWHSWWRAWALSNNVLLRSPAGRASTGPANIRLVILHYHIFKNAGSTIEDILDHSFGERFSKMETSAGEGLIANPALLRFLEERPDVRAISSHQIRYPVPRAPGYLFFDICFLRDPIDRVRSIYVYFRRKPNPEDPVSVLANRCELGDFVAAMIQEFPLYVKNVQVNLLACGGDSDEPEPSHLELAVQRMWAASFLGIVDEFDLSVKIGAGALRCAFPELDCNRLPLNVLDGLQGSVASRTEQLRQACRKDVFEELLHLNALDQQLVDEARLELKRRLNDVPQPELRLLQPRKADTPPAGKPKALARRLLALAPYWRELSGTGRKTLFDRVYYRSTANRKAARAFPLLHFLLWGAFQGRPSHPLFDPAFYLRRYPGVAAAGVNPLCHYLKYGAKELRQPHPLFDPVFYLDRNPDVRDSGVNPLVHYLRHGAAEDRKPLALFDPVYYRSRCLEAPRIGANPLRHFLESGAIAASPHPLFDCQAYVAAYPQVTGNPLLDYLVALNPAEEPWPSSPREPASVVLLIIQDVPVAVVCPEIQLEAKVQAEWIALYAAWRRSRATPCALALLLPDGGPRPHSIAEPQQEPFLRSLRLDQLRSQAKAEVQQANPAMAMSRLLIR
jgi:hypothetical protein